MVTQECFKTTLVIPSYSADYLRNILVFPGSHLGITLSTPQYYHAHILELQCLHADITFFTPWYYPVHNLVLPYFASGIALFCTGCYPAHTPVLGLPCLHSVNKLTQSLPCSHPCMTLFTTRYYPAPQDLLIPWYYLIHRLVLPLSESGYF